MKQRIWAVATTEAKEITREKKEKSRVRSAVTENAKEMGKMHWTGSRVTLDSEWTPPEAVKVSFGGWKESRNGGN